MTLLDVLLRPSGSWEIRIPTMALAVVGVLEQRALVTPALWLALAALTGLRVIADWPLPDNHAYLLSYWCLAIGLAATAPEARAFLARSASWLLGVAFVFAVLWKVVLAPEYLDGRFFKVTLVTDPRFEDAAIVLGGLTLEELAANRQALRPLPEGFERVDALPFVEPPAFRALATTSTWGLLVLELALAVAFFAPRTGRIRHALLLGFCIVVYSLAPVAGFGWLLLSMGLAQCDAQARGVQAAYTIVFLWVLLHSEMSWAALVRVVGSGASAS